MRTLLSSLVMLYLLWTSCESPGDTNGIDYRQEMRTFVQEISSYAKSQDEDFIIIPQNGHELLLNEGEKDTANSYLSAIDGLGQESLFFGYSGVNEATPEEESSYKLSLLKIGLNYGKTVLVTDYCNSTDKVNSSYSMNNTRGHLSFAAPARELNMIPLYPDPIPGENNLKITSLNQARNFLYLLNMENYETKNEFIKAVQATNYDIVIMDAFFHGGIFTAEDVQQLKMKANGGSRLVISYMSIGEAEDYRYYWEESWEAGNPDFIRRENPNWKGNYKVEYWEPEWKNIITGNESSYTQRILDAGFDGVYLDLIDAFFYFENL